VCEDRLSTILQFYVDVDVGDEPPDGTGLQLLSDYVDPDYCGLADHHRAVTKHDKEKAGLFGYLHGLF
jgi:hypothetical protein